MKTIRSLIAIAYLTIAAVSVAAVITQQPTPSHGDHLGDGTGATPPELTPTPPPRLDPGPHWRWEIVTGPSPEDPSVQISAYTWVRR